MRSVDNCDMSRGFHERLARDAAITKLIARPHDEYILSQKSLILNNH